MVTRQRFVIVSHQRSGTNLLRRTLRQNPEIHCGGEAFKGPRDGRSTANRFLDAIASDKPVRGCVIHFDHFQEHPDLRDYLQNQLDLRVILLRRENALRRLLSWKVAQATQRYVSTEPETIPPPRVTITPQELIEDSQLRNAQELEFMTCCRLTAACVSYENLTTQMAIILQHVQWFLGTNAHILAPACERMETRPLSEAIENYDELARHFKGTQYEAWFRDVTDPVFGKVFYETGGHSALYRIDPRTLPAADYRG